MTLFVLLLILLFVMIFLGIPVAFGVVGASVLILGALRGFENLPFDMIAQRMLYGVNNYVLLAIPAFLLVGRLMNSAGVTDRIFNVARALVGHHKGGLGHVNVLASMIFAGISGSAVADAGGLGVVEIKAMTDDGYPLEFSSALTAASATIGPIIPPSIGAVIYGALASESVGKIFIGSIIPGIMMSLGMMGIVAIISQMRNYPTKKKATLRELLGYMKESFLPLLVPIIIIGGILSGVFTATEASAVAVCYCVVISFFVYRTISTREFTRIIKETMIDTAVILFIIGSCSIYSWVLGRYQVIHELIRWLAENVHHPGLLLLYINLFLLLIGCFIDTGPALFLLTPILVPLIKEFGIDPIHFGVVIIFNLGLGVITPPVGTVLYTVAKVVNVPLEKLVKAILPFYIPLLITLVLITYVPQIVLFIPSLVFK